jgi:RNA polymerase-binding transcription factor DksA
MTTELIRARLFERRHDLLARYREHLALVAEELDTREIETIENATELWDAQVLSRLSDADARTLADIVAAIERLDDGSYGKCLECGVAVGTGRLAVLPEAATCIDCAIDASRVTPPRIAR